MLLPVTAPLRPTAVVAARRSDLARATVLGLGLVVVVAARYGAIQAGIAEPIAAGIAFGVVLLGLAVLGGWVPARRLPARGRSGRRAATSAAIGAAGGAGLVALALLGRALLGAPDLPPIVRPDLFPAWSIATVIVATGEEAVLRGALLDRLARLLGLGPAILLTSVAFAVMHVPFYGWHVVPLDLGVGLWLAGLRLASRGIVAPSIAHAIADLATWWL